MDGAILENEDGMMPLIHWMNFGGIESLVLKRLLSCSVSHQRRTNYV